jgi:hypothetical protein
LQGAKQLLETEPGGSRVVVSVITTDSFGSVREILKGWTPEAHGVFNDDLVAARHQLAASFMQKSANMTPISSGADIIGAVWHIKTIMQSDNRNNDASREIWILSDMMNETATLPMPAMMALGPAKMLEQAKANGLLVDLKGYTVHVWGASMRGLSPQAYFRSAEAELVSYSPEIENR